MNYRTPPPASSLARVLAAPPDAARRALRQAQANADAAVRAASAKRELAWQAQAQNPANFVETDQFGAMAQTVPQVMLAANAVQPVDEVIRIRTGERGPDAI